jgi:hypothetical protein
MSHKFPDGYTVTVCEITTVATVQDERGKTRWTFSVEDERPSHVPEWYYRAAKNLYNA